MSSTTKSTSGLSCLQVFRSPSRTRKLPSDRTSALRSHLHRLPRLAADEAAHGSVTEEAQVSLLFSFCVKKSTVQCLFVAFISATRNCLSDEILHYWLIGLAALTGLWIHCASAKFSLLGGSNLASLLCDPSARFRPPGLMSLPFLFSFFALYNELACTWGQG